MQSWYFIAIISIIAVAIGEIAQKLSITSKKDFSAETINFSIGVLQTIFSLVFVIIIGESFPNNFTPQLFIQLVVSSIIAFFFFKFLYTSYKGNSASISQVIFSLSVIVSTTLGILIFHESVTIAKFIGITVIVIGVIIANYKKGEKFSKYNLLAILAALTYGFLAIMDKSFSTTISIHWYQVLFSAGYSIISLIFAGRKITREVRQMDILTFRTIFISAVTFTIFNKLTYLSYSLGGEIGKVDAINNTNVFLIILMEYFILKERTDIKKKIISSVLAVAGVIILGFI
jgi:drug/metabolite transporter (DMT)-like permease